MAGRRGKQAEVDGTCGRHQLSMWNLGFSEFGNKWGRRKGFEKKGGTVKVNDAGKNNEEGGESRIEYDSARSLSSTVGTGNPLR